MKNITVITAVVLLLNLIISPASAQEDQSGKKGVLEIGFGPNFYGPAQHMADLMVEHNFDERSPDGFFSEGVDHPNVSKVGFTAHISYQHKITPLSQVGLRFNYSFFDNVSGYSTVGGHLRLKLSSYSFVPLYSWAFDEHWELDLGPILSINSGAKNDYSDGLTDKSSQISSGLLAGLNHKVWNGRGTSGELGVCYMLVSGSKIGPFPTDNDDSFPKSKLNYSHLNLVFNFGIKL